MAEEEELFSTQQAAQMLGLTDARLRQLIALKEAFPTKRFGVTYVFTRAEIERIRNRPRSPRGRKPGSKKT